MPDAYVWGMRDDDLEHRAGKPVVDDRPDMAGGADDPDPSDYADPRAAQPGQDPPAEDALQGRDRDAS